MKKQIKVVYNHCATRTKVADITDIKIETENAYHEQGYQGQEGGIIITDQLEVVRVDAVEVASIEALKKSLILTGI